MANRTEIPRSPEVMVRLDEAPSDWDVLVPPAPVACGTPEVEVGGIARPASALILLQVALELSLDFPGT